MALWAFIGSKGCSLGLVGKLMARAKAGPYNHMAVTVLPYDRKHESPVGAC